MKSIIVFLTLLISLSFLFGFQHSNENIEQTETEEYPKDSINIQKGMKFVFYYKTSESTRPSKDVREFLDKLGNWMILNPTTEIRVTGHSDQVGTLEEIQERSEKRATEIKNYLVSKHGISPRRLLISGKGARMPIGEMHTEEGKAKNRRVEIEVIGE